MQTHFVLGDVMENERKVYFTCDTKVDWDTYKELDSIKYRKLNRLSFVVLIAFAALTGLLFWMEELNLTFCILSFCCSFIFLYSFVMVRKISDKMQGQQRIRYGKDVIDCRIEFSDKIYVFSSCDQDRSYEYALVEKVYETQNSVIIVMTYGVTLTVDKLSVRCQDGTDFKQFIFDKCYSLKKRRFIKLKNGQKKLKSITVLSFLLSVVILMLFFFQQTPENWRELGRNPLYSSSQQSTSDINSDLSK